MKSTSAVLLSVLLASPLVADASQRLIPAGSLISCTTEEPRISSRTMAVGDPVVCQISHAERYGHTGLPYHSYLVGRFEDYKDPGHFVGKGWMELRFDRMMIEPDTVIPVSARVIDVHGYHVDNQGHVLGKGHAVRDVVTWSIPILWPIDLLMLPRRGPSPTLKGETRLTLKVMDDLELPATPEPQTDPYGLKHREPSAEATPPPAPAPEPQTPPQTAYVPPVEPPQPAPYYAQPAYTYAPPPPMPVAVYAYSPAILVPQPVAMTPMVVMPAPVYAYAPMAYAPPVYANRYDTAYGYAGPRAYGYPGPTPYSQSYAYGGAVYRTGLRYYSSR